MRFNPDSNIALGVVSILGICISSVLVAFAQRRADEILAEDEDDSEEADVEEMDEEIEDSENEPEEEDDPRSKRWRTFKKVWKCYIPAGIAVAITIASVAGNAMLNWKTIAGLTGTIGYVTAERDMLERKAREKFGDEAVDEILKNIKGGKTEKETKTIYIKIPVEDTGNGDTFCYDSYCGRLFLSDEGAVREGIKEFNEGLLEYEEASVYDLHSIWGLAGSDFARNQGWYKGRYDKNFSDDGVSFKVYWLTDRNASTFSDNRLEKLSGDKVLIIEYEDEPCEAYWQYKEAM